MCKLDYPVLPPYESFYSSLSNCNVLEKEYSHYQAYLSEAHSQTRVLKIITITEPPKTGRQNNDSLLETWRDNNMSTFKYVLMWYNNLDTKTFVEAVEKLTELYRSKAVLTLLSMASVFLV